MFNRMDVLRVNETVRVRNEPHTGADLLGQFEEGQGVVVLAGPEESDGITWYKVGGIVVGQGETIGYCAQTLDDGTIMMDRAPFEIASPAPAPSNCAQLFGENPALYAQFGYRAHVGLDYALVVGTPLFAIDDGHIEHAGWDETGFGNMIKLVTHWGEAIYGHLSQVDVHVGQSVAKGQEIGLSGDTGFSGGPHLHLQCRFNPWHYDNGFGGCSDFWPYLPAGSLVIPHYVLD